MPRVRLDVDAATVGIGMVRSRLARMRPALEAVADELQDAQAERFTSVRFRRLSPAYARRKARRGLSSRPLTGGDLERDVLGRGPHSIKRIGREDVAVGVGNPVARIHKAGRKAGGRGGQMPRRAPIASPSRQVRERLLARIRDHVLNV